MLDILSTFDKEMESQREGEVLRNFTIFYESCTVLQK
jgi:hypothetical protein